MTLKTTMDNSGNNDSWPANRQTIVMPNGQRQRVHSFAFAAAAAAAADAVAVAIAVADIALSILEQFWQSSCNRQQLLRIGQQQQPRGLRSNPEELHEKSPRDPAWQRCK